MAATSLVHEFLRDARVPYTVLPHSRAVTARGEAAAAHVPGDHWAKVVICVADGEPIQAVVPATRTVDLEALLDLTGAMKIRLATEEELRLLYPDCQDGAIPPFGHIFRQRVFVDIALAGQTHIVFNSGRHTEAIAMRSADFASVVRPIIADFAQDDGNDDGGPVQAWW